jgi:uncharacterized RDD family membrane protein YckC
MPWYYAEGAQQNGPVTDEKFGDLVQSGKVRAETLVWREGMANWQPYFTVAAPTGAPSIAPPPGAAIVQPQLAAHEVICQHCGKVVTKENAIQYGAVWVCADCKPLFVQKLREGADVPAGQLLYAGFWIRFVAKFIDGLIVGVVFFAPAMIIMFRSRATGGPPDLINELMVNLVFNLASTVVMTVYNTFFVGKFGASPGKMAVGLRIVTSDGGRVSYARALGRSLAEILSGIVCYIGYIIAAFDGQKRTLHDHICDTRVIRK